MTYGPDPVPPPDLAREASDPVLPPPFGTARSFGGVVVLFILMLLGMMLVGGAAQFFLGFAANAMLTEVLVVLGPVWFLLRRHGAAEALRLNVRPDSGLLAWAILGVLSLAVLVAEFTHWSDLVFPMPESVKAAYLDAVTAGSVPELLLLVLAAGLVPGICEEAAFRGYFQRVGVERYGTSRGILLASALFALMHLDPWHLVALFGIGLYLGMVYLWTGNLWIPAAAHAANNAASVILLYLAPESTLSQVSEPPPRWLLPLAAVGLVATLRHLRRTHRASSSVSPPNQRILS